MRDSSLMTQLNDVGLYNWQVYLLIISFLIIGLYTLLTILKK